MKKIIIAEPLRRALQQQHTLFARGGIEFISADTSEEILDQQRGGAADLIITDFSLPKMGGVKLCAALRADPELRDVSIILVCDGADIILAQGQEVQANAVVAKPLNPAELFSRISELLVVPQRQDMRTLLHVSLTGKGAHSSFLGVSHNVSLSGMLLETDRALKKRDHLSFSFQLGHRKIETKSEVVRMNRLKNGRYLYGVKFLNLDTKSLILIEQYVKGKVRH